MSRNIGGHCAVCEHRDTYSLDDCMRNCGLPRAQLNAIENKRYHQEKARRREEEKKRMVNIPSNDEITKSLLGFCNQIVNDYEANNKE